MRTRFVILALLLFSTIVLGQPRASESQMQRLEQFKKLKLIELLDLKEEQSVRFFSRMHEHEKRKQEIMQKKDALLDKIERIIRNRGDENELSAVFAEIDATDRAMLQEDSSFRTSLDDLLSKEQIGKLFLFERQFHRELRDAMREIRGRRPGPF